MTKNICCASRGPEQILCQPVQNALQLQLQGICGLWRLPPNKSHFRRVKYWSSLFFSAWRRVVGHGKWSTEHAACVSCSQAGVANKPCNWSRRGLPPLLHSPLCILGCSCSVWGYLSNTGLCCGGLLPSCHHTQLLPCFDACVYCISLCS